LRQLLVLHYSDRRGRQRLGAGLRREQGRRKPEGPARVLLTLAWEHPEWLLNQAKKRREVSTRSPRK